MNEPIVVIAMVEPLHGATHLAVMEIQIMDEIRLSGAYGTLDGAGAFTRMPFTPDYDQRFPLESEDSLGRWIRNSIRGVLQAGLSVEPRRIDPRPKVRDAAVTREG